MSMPQSEQRSMTTTEWSHLSLTTAPGTLQVTPQTRRKAGSGTEIGGREQEEP